MSQADEESLHISRPGHNHKFVFFFVAPCVLQVAQAVEFRGGRESSIVQGMDDERILADFEPGGGMSGKQE